TVVRLVVHLRFVLWREEREDMHAGCVVPNEKRFAVFLGLVHEIVAAFDEILVESRHVVLGLQEWHIVHVGHVRHVGIRRQRTFLGNFLLSNFSPAWLHGGIIGVAGIAVY